jgi:hypothetical protein
LCLRKVCPKRLPAGCDGPHVFAGFGAWLGWPPIRYILQIHCRRFVFFQGLGGAGNQYAAYGGAGKREQIQGGKAAELHRNFYLFFPKREVFHFAQR